jgi:glycosyltransferase involved in cell wall biosynthesis
VIVAHSCVLSWWRAVLSGRAPAKYDRYRAEVRRGLREADAVVAPTRAMLETVRGHYGAAARGHIIPNGVDLERFSIGTKEPFVLCAGRLWDEAKNLGVLASIAGRAPWPIYMAGGLRSRDGEERRRGCLRELGLLAQAELHRWMSRAAIYALPARYEPFGLTVLEAALSGCALILGDIPSLRETWRGAAIFVRPEDGAGLLTNLERLAGDERLRARMGSLAWLRARRFTADRMARRYLHLYATLAARRNGSGVRPCA